VTEPDLYEQLPAVHRRRDAEQGYPLQALLGLISEQQAILIDEIDQLYDDWFIETCQDWVVPYLGELVGYHLLHGFEEALASGSEEARGLLRVIASRRDVANTIGNRRRKGTLALLEDLAADVAGWPGRAVEFRSLLALEQPIRVYGSDLGDQHRRRHRGRLVDLRAGDALDRLDGPFDEVAHSVDVRRINSARTPGVHNISEVGLFVWRLRPYPITRAPAYCRDQDRMQFTFSILGNDTPLITNPVREPNPSHLADETNVPAFVRRRAFTQRPAAYYGPGKSFCIWLDDAAGAAPVALDQIVSADLSGWSYSPALGQVAVDPVLGRIAFPARHAPDTGVWVSYHYGMSADIGGGEYPRPPTPLQTKTYHVGTGQQFERITDALTHWATDKTGPNGPHVATIELVGSLAYEEKIEIRVDLGDRLTVRAAPGSRPVLRLLDWSSNRADALKIVGTGKGEGAEPRVMFDGLLITGRNVRVQGRVGQLVLTDTTLVPGWSIDEECECAHPNEPSLELFDTPVCVQIERSILGTILVNREELTSEPNKIFLSDSILDACSHDRFALTAPLDRHAYAELSTRRSTVIGRVRTHAVDLVENSILVGDTHVARRQAGCVRFSYLAPGSRVPQHFHCEPELSGEPRRVQPLLTSERYGTPGYGQLATNCASELSRGADDGSELGVFHRLFQPQREDNLALRINEYLPAGCDAGIILAT
jgi:hypothetical protein